MNKAELVAYAAEREKLPKAQVSRVFDLLLEGIARSSLDGDRVTLVGFGTFRLGERARRKGRNPQTGEKIEIPASKIVKFKASNALKVN